MDGPAELEAASLHRQSLVWAVFALTYVEHTKKGPLWLYAPLLVFTLALIPVRMAKHQPPGALHGITN